MTLITDRFETADDIQGDDRKALCDLLMRLGDDALMIGHRNSEWTGIGPILEEDIAFSSMAQDKIGHALVFYGMLQDLGIGDPDSLAYLRGAEDFRCASLTVLECFLDDAESEASAALSNNPVRDRLVSEGDWSLAFMRQFLFSEADALRMSALESSTYEPLAQFARKVRGEIKYHCMHGRMIIDRLTSGGESVTRKMQRALDELYPHALGLFEKTKWSDRIATLGLGPDEATLCEAWRSAITGLLAPTHLALPEHAQPIHGGRAGEHPAELTRLLDALQKVNRLDPGAKW